MPKISFQNGYDFAEVLPLFTQIGPDSEHTEPAPYNLGIGDIKAVPGLEPILLEASKRLGAEMPSLTSNLPGMQGHWELCEALAEIVASETGLSLSPDEIIITDGGCDGIALSALASCGSEDGVAYALPAFPYWCVLAATGLRQVPVLFETPIEYQRSFGEKMIETFKRDTKVKAFILNEPQNPMGLPVEPSQLRLLGEYVSSRDITVICDDVGRGLMPISADWWGRHFPPDKIIIVDSFTKRFACPGLRLGFVHTPAHYMKTLRGLVANLRGGVSNLAAHFGHLLIEELKSANKMEIVRETVAGRLSDLKEGLADFPEKMLDVFRPAWGIYALLSFAKLKRKAGITGRAVVVRMRENGILAMNDGFLYPADLAWTDRDSFVRLSVGGESRILDALARLREVLQILAR